MQVQEVRARCRLVKDGAELTLQHQGVQAQRTEHSVARAPWHPRHRTRVWCDRRPSLRGRMCHIQHRVATLGRPDPGLRREYRVGRLIGGQMGRDVDNSHDAPCVVQRV